MNTSPITPLGKKSAARQRVLLSWQINILIFGVLIAIVVGIFYWQLQQLKDTFHQHARERSRVVANVIEENLKNSILSRRALDEIVQTFLTSTSRFIIYLNSVEPFTSDELTAFASEAGLAGISIISSNSQVVSGPRAWLPDRPTCSPPAGQVHYIDDRNLGVMMMPVEDSADISCVMVGLDAGRIMTLQEKTGLSALLKSLPSLPGIQYVQIIRQKEQQKEKQPPGEEVKLLRVKGRLVAESRRPVDDGVLVVGLNAQQLIIRTNSLRSHFFLFGIMLTLLGVFFSWLLYRHQQADLQRTRTFERMLARQHEAAALGRATATIAHEVRNPLNAINMGLQRLHLEWDNLNPEQEELISAMGKAVQRTSNIVTELQRFTRPLSPVTKKIRLNKLLKQTLALYEPGCREQGIRLETDLNFSDPVVADSDLLAEVFENLIKNAVEAQPEGGFLSTRLFAEKKRLLVIIKNGGFSLSQADIGRMGEPYFTTKTRGTGLGLAISRRLIEAHGGQLSISSDQERQSLTVTVELPL